MDDTLIRPGRERLSWQQKSAEKAKIAYFSMEIGINAQMPTYSGGLGILAGDTIKSFADLRIPTVAVTLLYRRGYFYQQIDDTGQQHELPNIWDIDDYLSPLPEKITLSIEGRPVAVQAWLYFATSNISEYSVPIVFLDTDLEENSAYDRSLSYFLYGGDEKYRLAQEMVLGIGGVRMLDELGYKNIERYHLNEGHASLLALELLREHKPFGVADIETVRQLCVFTTHTPVAAGHDIFPFDLAELMLGDFIPMDFLRRVGGNGALNMTLLALNLSHYINGVAKGHGKVSREMFPGYRIDSITNGIHSYSWACECFKRLFFKYIPGWSNDPFSFRYALSIPLADIWETHQKAKNILLSHILRATGIAFSREYLTIGFARRSTAYKRADLIFRDIERLKRINRQAGKIQLVFAGKAHPKDEAGKALIDEISDIARGLRGEISVVYLENYDIDLARMLVSGVDLWLNTPRRPKEASGTSGMKAALNGVPSLSILDGWWIEGCIEGLTGWAIGSAEDTDNNDDADAASMYDKLEKTIIPLFYGHRNRWSTVMRNAIAINASFFNTHRMVQQYVLNAYLY